VINFEEKTAFFELVGDTSLPKSGPIEKLLFARRSRMVIDCVFKKFSENPA